ncbi:MAG: small multi-drug export protein [Desulfatitalea sp.]
MKYAKKIVVLLHRGGRKIAQLLQKRFDLVEVKIIAIGLGLALVAGIYLLYLLFADTRLYGLLSSTVMLHLMGGWWLGVATCLSAGISVLATILYNMYVEVVIILLAYGVVVLVLRNLIQHKFLHSKVRQAELAAQGHKTRIKKYGGIGLFLFVIFPFFMTGPVIGSIIGYLLNYKPINNFLIVLSATLTSIVAYSLAGHKVIGFLERYIHIDAAIKWGALIIGGLFVLFLIYHIKSIKAFLDSDDEEM